MADLSPFADRMNDTEISNNAPVTATVMRRIGQNLNFLLDLLNVADGSAVPSGGGYQEFLTAGAHSFTVDPGLNRIYYVLVGAGGGGGGNSGSTSNGGGGGGGGGIIDGYSSNFVVAETVSINIGTGGTAGVGASGGNGGNSTLTSTYHSLTAYGGRGGKVASAAATAVFGNGGGHGFRNPAVYDSSFIDSIQFLTNSGGNPNYGSSYSSHLAQGANSSYNSGGTSTGTIGQFGGGGGAGYGKGGNAGSSSSGSNGSSSSAGGGGGGSSGSGVRNGGTGGSGVCRIFIPLTT